jgi:imidazole glycerol-phosphate synthase subunit HisF
LSYCRLIARLDIKGVNVIKGVQMEGLRIVGDPNDLAKKYYEEGADELLFVDTVASLYDRDNILKVVEHAASNVFIPLTVAGGVRTLENAKQLLLSGADKVALNTGAISRPDLLTEIANVFGSQCVVLSVEAKLFENNWELMTNNGRERTGNLLGPWISSAAKYGVGEIVVTSVDKDGTKNGLDIPLMNFARECTDLPLIGCGGVASEQDLTKGFGECKLDGIGMATALHFKSILLPEMKEKMRLKGFEVRQ